MTNFNTNSKLTLSKHKKDRSNYKKDPDDASWEISQIFSD